MVLRPGSKVQDGVIIGRHGAGSAPEQVADALEQVATALRTHHGFICRVHDDSIRGFGPLTGRDTSPATNSGSKGTVVRVRYGSGHLLINGQRHHLDYGDWAFVPADMSYRLKGDQVISGMNLRMITAQLK